METIKLKNITNYRIYTTHNLNPGNANAFLKNGDVSKVSSDTTRLILQFVNEYRYFHIAKANANALAFDFLSIKIISVTKISKGRISRKHQKSIKV